jgi:hypothetical protein
MTISEELRKEIQKSVDEVLTHLESVDFIPIDQIAEAFPEGNWAWYRSSEEIEFLLPYDFALIDRVKKYCQDVLGYEKGYESQHIWDMGKSGEAGMFIHFHNPADRKYNHTLRIAFRTAQTGAKCVVKQIGVKETPVYEVVCEEGAKENAL